jgi:hypothetical protein
MKKAIRRVVLSATYRQSVLVNDKAAAADPRNQLLWRHPGHRLGAEVIRDQGLAISGLLNLEIGGPSVHPVQVPNLWKEIGFLRPEIGMDEWPTSEGPDLYRRGLYTFWRRVCTYPTFSTFDAPSREVCTVRRERSNTPLQALVTLNDPVYMEAAQSLARRIAAVPGTPTEKLTQGFALTLVRAPKAEELKPLLTLYAKSRERFARDTAQAMLVATKPLGALPPNAEVAEFAAWTVVGNVLLNLDEFLMKP